MLYYTCKFVLQTCVDVRVDDVVVRRIARPRIFYHRVLPGYDPSLFAP